jgi:hypothetical protein
MLSFARHPEHSLTLVILSRPKDGEGSQLLPNRKTIRDNIGSPKSRKALGETHERLSIYILIRPIPQGSPPVSTGTWIPQPHFSAAQNGVKRKQQNPNRTFRFVQLANRFRPDSHSKCVRFAPSHHTNSHPPDLQRLRRRRRHCHPERARRAPKDLNLSQTSIASGHDRAPPVRTVTKSPDSNDHNDNAIDIVHNPCYPLK